MTTSNYWVTIDLSPLKKERQHAFWNVMRELPYFDGPTVVTEGDRKLNIDSIFLKFPTEHAAKVGYTSVVESANIMHGFHAEAVFPKVKLFYKTPVRRVGKNTTRQYKRNRRNKRR